MTLPSAAPYPVAGTAKPLSPTRECSARVTFCNREAAAFVSELKREVAQWFAEQGKSDKATVGMVAKTVLLLGLLGGSYGLLVSNAVTGAWAQWGLIVVIGVAMAGIGFGIAHDALHGAYSSSDWLNTMLGGTFDLLGGNSYMWKITHNVIHHTYTNIHGVDEDLAVSPLLRLSPEAPWRPVHRFQHLYAFATYSMSTLFWVFAKDYKYFLQKDLGPLKDRKHSAGAITWLIFSKIAYLVYALAIPLVFIHRPWWAILLGFLAAHVIAGTILGVVFQLAHVVEGTQHPTPDEAGLMEHAWAVHEMRTTSNFARGNAFVSWYVGGLNYQIEHHLFPRICSVHYPAISHIVHDVAARYQIPYNEHRTLWGAIASHYRTLRQFGRPRVAPAT